MKTCVEIRQDFLDFFQNKDHEVVASSSLVPGNDPTLLFTNAGMVQFKDTFLGDEPRPYVRATSSQRCVRAGGKHNDLENVGYTARHHTFFEMLGNFSFGDYFKSEAIHLAWEFLTDVLKLPEEKLWVTVFDEDDEAANIWLKDVGVAPERLSRIGAKDNFWSMGDTGPCGPCSEIFFDHGPDVAGGPPGTPEEDGDRYIEIWNLVFMQYDRAKDGTLTPLPKPSVDTGMGLERLAAVLQNVHSNYEIDLFVNLIKAVSDVTGCSDAENKSLCVIADHIRSCAFMIVDGVLPSNEGRGYVLRRIIRRAIRHGAKLGATEPFFYKLVDALDAEMGQAYPELTQQKANVQRALKQEEERFAETLELGLNILEKDIADLTGNEIPGETIFKLYDTYGFPADLTADIARERNLGMDMAGFEACMEAQRNRGRAANQFGVDDGLKVEFDAATEFCGYTQLDERATVIGLYLDGEPVNELLTESSGIVVLDKTPFYAESGGQVGDQGILSNDNVLLRVMDTQKISATISGHQCQVKKGPLHVGDSVDAHVTESVRLDIARNHSVTHLLHAALRQILGEHVTQKGSLVDPERLRFDFSHFEAVSDLELTKVESLVNQKIRENLIVDTQLLAYDQAIEAGAMALFGEKYTEEVRVLSMGEFSVELCGGTHVSRTGDIGLFKISSEGGIAAGIRRIEAVTGDTALRMVNARNDQLKQLAERLKTDDSEVLKKLDQVLLSHRELEKELQQLKSKMASQVGSELHTQAVSVSGGAQVLAVAIENADPKSLRETLDQLKNKLDGAVIVLATVSEGKVSLAAGVDKSLCKTVKAGDLVNMVAQQVGGKGGGRPDMAMAGGNQPENLVAALDSVVPWVDEKLS